MGPTRIISLVPSVTELLVQWGLASRLVGRTAYCVEPPWLRSTVPAVGGTKNPDLAKIIALKPDLVVLEEDENTLATAESLSQAGLNLLVLRVRSLEDCLRAYEALGRSVGQSQAGKAQAASLKAALKALGRRPKAPGPRTLTLIWKGPWMSAGPGTYVADLVRRAGLTPIGPERYPVLSESELDALAPEWLLLPDEPYRFTARHQTELSRRFPQAQVLRLDGRSITWYLSRTEQGLEALAERLRATLNP